MGFACDCNSQGKFLTVAPKSKFVALVKVNKYLTYKDIYDKPMPMSMEVEVEIIEIFKGTERRKTVTVWGDNGILCRPYLNRFAVGNYYVISFENTGGRGLASPEEKPTDYAISICGDYWLEADIKSGMANGSVSKELSRISFVDLRRRLAK